MDKRLLLGLLFASLIACLGISPLWAQDAGTGSVNGIVRNDRGEPLGGVSVVANNLTTGLSAGTQTDTAGVFHFPKLPSKGRYSFSFSSVGFQSQTLAGYTVK